MRIRTHQHFLTLVFISLLSFGLISCSSSDKTNPSKSTMLVPLNKEIQVVLDNGLDLIVEVIVDGNVENPYPLSNLVVDEVNKTLSGDLAVELPAGPHELKLVYYIDDPVEGKIEIVSTGDTTVSVVVVAGETSTADFSAVAMTYADQDNDGRSNFVELTTSTPFKVPNTPDVPQNVTVINSDGNVELAWTSALGATNYYIYMTTNASLTKTNYADFKDGMQHQVKSSANPTFSHPADVPLINGTKYYFIITATNGLGDESAESTKVEGIPNGNLAKCILDQSKIDECLLG